MDRVQRERFDKLCVLGLKALNEDKFAEGEFYLAQAFEINPYVIDLWTSLAVAIGNQSTPHNCKLKAMRNWVWATLAMAKQVGKEVTNEDRQALSYFIAQACNNWWNKVVQTQNLGSQAHLLISKGVKELLEAIDLAVELHPDYPVNYKIILKIERRIVLLEEMYAEDNPPDTFFDRSFLDLLFNYSEQSRVALNRMI